MYIINALKSNIKNISGWKTDRKLVVFSVDDYGNVRLDSKKARARMDAAGSKVHSRFDAYDTLETKDDLEILFETLQSVKDKNGDPAIFTPFSLPCNINFEKMEEEGNQQYIYEILPQTFKKLASYSPKSYKGTWELWKEGIVEGLMSPQFHGREHFNVRVFEEKLKKRDVELLISLKNRSYTSIRNTGYSTIGTTAAFEFWDINENERFKKIIADGLSVFEKVFGNQATNFNAPGAPEHHSIHPSLAYNGVKYIDSPWIKKEHQGFNKYKTTVNYTGKKTKSGLILLVRNAVFEPTELSVSDWVGYTMKQIQAAFRFSKPAIISSHRVNFCGHIDPENRNRGIVALKTLLNKIVKKWPEVEFISASTLGDIISQNNSY